MGLRRPVGRPGKGQSGRRVRASLAEREGAVLLPHEHLGLQHLLDDGLGLGAGLELAFAAAHLLL